MMVFWESKAEVTGTGWCGCFALSPLGTKGKGFELGVRTCN